MLQKVYYTEQVTSAISFKIIEAINPRDYLDLTDVTTIANTPIEEGEDATITAWRAEANEILLWVTKLWLLRDRHIDLLDFPTELNPLDFVAGLPQL